MHRQWLDVVDLLAGLGSAAALMVTEWILAERVLGEEQPLHLDPPRA